MVCNIISTLSNEKSEIIIWNTAPLHLPALFWFIDQWAVTTNLIERWIANITTLNSIGFVGGQSRFYLDLVRFTTSFEVPK